MAQLAQSLLAPTATFALGKGQRYALASEGFAELKLKKIATVVPAPSGKERDKTASHGSGGRGQGAACECQEGDTSLRLRALLLEDDPDVALVQGLLEAQGYICNITRARTRVEFLEALRTAAIDIILADYELPSFDGLSALQLALTERARPALHPRLRHA